MIFATDLDKTMIYSKKYTEGFDSDLFYCIEPADGRNISYITKKSFKILCDMLGKVRVIPTTARTIEEFKRVEIFRNMEYAITTCGGVILKNGEVLKEWDEAVNRMIDPMVKQFDKICKILGKQEFIIREPSILDGKGIFTKTDNSDKCRKFLEKMLDTKDWDIFIEGKKVYILPWFVRKEHAISFLKGYLKEKKVITAGDAVMDSGMVLYGDKAFIPKHGSLMANNNMKLYESVSIVPEEGIFAGQSILEKVHTIVCK